MKLLVLSDADVKRLLPMAECVEVMERALRDLTLGHAEQPLRMIVRPERAPGLLGLMPAYRQAAGEAAAFGLKVIGVFDGNREKGKDSHQGAVLLQDGETGEPLALMNASAITAIRTAAVSGVATRTLARSNACDVAILGASVQAVTHLEAMACVRPLRRVRVASRHFESAERFAAAVAPGRLFSVEAVRTGEEAVRGADIVVTVTNSAEPVVARDWIKNGAHINAVGSSVPSRREIDTATMASAWIFVDRRESAEHEAGDYILAAGEGAIGPESIRAELGEVLTGQMPGRTSDDHITLFKSLGLAIEDLAAAQYLFRRARAEGAGAWVEF